MALFHFLNNEIVVVMCCNLVTKSTPKIINNGIFSKKSINNGECSTSLPNGENRSLSCGAKKANPNAVLAKEKKAATQLGVIVGEFIIVLG